MASATSEGLTQRDMSASGVANHFGCGPDAVTWVASYLKGLRGISDAAFQEGECAA
jgi:hypothetical protein